MTSLIFGFDRSAGETAEDSTGSFQSGLDALQNLTTGMIRHMESRLSPKHAGACGQQYSTENSSQPQYRNASAQVRAEQPARDGADEESAHEGEINITQPPVEQAGHAGKRHGMHDVCADHHFGREAVKQQQQHHNDAA